MPTSTSVMSDLYHPDGTFAYREGTSLSARCPSALDRFGRDRPVSLRVDLKVPGPMPPGKGPLRLPVRHADVDAKVIDAIEVAGPGGLHDESTACRSGNPRVSPEHGLAKGRPARGQRRSRAKGKLVQVHVEHRMSRPGHLARAGVDLEVERLMQPDDVVEVQQPVPVQGTPVDPRERRRKDDVEMRAGSFLDVKEQRHADPDAAIREMVQIPGALQLLQACPQHTVILVAGKAGAAQHLSGAHADGDVAGIVLLVRPAVVVGPIGQRLFA